MGEFAALPKLKRPMRTSKSFRKTPKNVSKIVGTSSVLPFDSMTSAYAKFKRKLSAVIDVKLGKGSLYAPGWICLDTGLQIVDRFVPSLLPLSFSQTLINTEGEVPSVHNIPRIDIQTIIKSERRDRTNQISG